MNLRSIHFRLIIWYSSIILLVALVFSAYTIQGVYERLYDNMEQRLLKRGNLISENILPYLSGQRRQEVASSIHTMYAPEANSRFIRILNPDRSILYVSGPPKDNQFDPNKISVSGDVRLVKREERLSADNTLLIVTVPADINGKTYYIEVGSPTDSIQATLKSLILKMMSGLPVVIFIAAAGIYMVVRHSLKPVENIRGIAEKITFGNLKKRLPVMNTGDELEHLTLTLNQMLERLDEAYQQSIRFSADASHELRTPLSIILGGLETMVDDPQLPEAFRARIGSLFEETERLSHITESLFSLSRLDAGEAKIQNKRFDLAAMMQNTTDQMAVLAEEKNIAIAISASEPVFISGDPPRIKQVMINLLDNAIKYTAEGGQIILKVYAAQQKAILEVRDNGAGISADALPHIFERFFRADKLHSRESGGAGLGLAIVRSIILAHGGHVDVSSIEERGTVCKVALPLAVGNRHEDELLAGGRYER